MIQLLAHGGKNDIATKLRDIKENIDINSIMKNPSNPTTRGCRQDKSTLIETPSNLGDITFPIVGIGASAGGLEALEQFLRQVSEQSGLALTFAEITATKTLEAELREETAKLKTLLESGRGRNSHH